MCGRFVMLTRDEVARVVAAVEQGIWLEPLDSETPRSQAFPGTAVPVFGPPVRHLSVGSFQWGFPVEWSKKPVFNTRIESALSGKGMWKKLVDEGRCIVPTASFFEPHATETVRSPRSGRAIKRAYEFAANDGAPLLLAGLSDAAHCSIVTTEPNPWVAPVHDRMPLILRFEEVPLWLEGDASDLAELAARDSLELLVRPDAGQASTDGASKSPTDSDQLSLF